MEAMTIGQALSAVNGELIAGEPDAVITGVSTDSRTVKPGDLFFALEGEKFDGHNFVRAAFDAGAAGVVVSKATEARPTTILVGDTLTALGDLARYYASLFDARTVGVTGSVGKTTTKEMIAEILSRRFNTLKNEMNFNNEIGVPLTLFALTREHEAVVVEMAMRLQGEIRRLAYIAQPDTGVITNIGMSHIERLGSPDAIAEAKAELIESLPVDGLAVLPSDDRYFDFLRGRCSCRVVSFGLSENADVRARNLELDCEGGAGFDMFLRDQEPFRVKLNVVGEHNVLNALAAAVVGWHYGVPPDDIRLALEAFESPENRARILHSSRGYVVLDDTYNASPTSMSSALSTLSKMAGTRKIAVLGDMLELGSYALEAHREIGHQAAKLGLTLLVTVGELARSIAEGAREAGMSAVETVETCDEAAEMLKPVVQSGDLILIKGSRAIRLEKTVDRLIS